jgi:flagellar biosynthesis GTPase FlhF
MTDTTTPPSPVENVSSDASTADVTPPADPDSTVDVRESETAGEVESHEPQKRKRRTKDEVAAEKKRKLQLKLAREEEKRMKQLEKEKRRLLKKSPPDDVPSGEEDLLDESEEDEDEVRSFAHTLRDYMRAEIAATMNEYKRDPVTADAETVQALQSQSEPVHLDLRRPPAKVSSGQFQRRRPTVIFV